MQLSNAHYNNTIVPLNGTSYLLPSYVVYPLQIYNENVHIIRMRERERANEYLVKYESLIIYDMSMSICVCVCGECNV